MTSYRRSCTKCGFAFATTLFYAAFAHVARAQYGATAEVEASMPSGSERDPTASATVVDTNDRSRSLETTDEVFSEIPGARARRLGVLGSFSGLSLRGTDFEHTTVLFDEVPLGSGAGGAFDLSTMPLLLLERVEVYRGGSPLSLGSGAIGGVLRFVPREDAGTRMEASVGTGSFGLASARAAASVIDRDGSPALTTAVGVRHSDGDYPYVHDSKTAFDPSDDVERHRQNANIDDGFGLMHVRMRALDGELTGIAMGYGRTGGLSGAPIEEPLETRRASTRGLALVSYSRGEPSRDAWRAQLTASASFDIDRLTDRLGELGGAPRARHDRTLRSFVRGYAELDATEHIAFAAIGSYQLDHFSPHDDLASYELASSLRHTGAAGGEARIHGRIGHVPAEARASARIEASRATLLETRPERSGQETSADELAPTFRIGAAIEPLRGVACSASASSGVRLPSLLELFGDQAYLLGDTRLVPEHSWSVDAGIVSRHAIGPLRNDVELRVFSSWIDDLIAYEPAGAYRFTPRNLDRARILGAEAGARTAFGRHASLVGSATFLDARDSTRDRTLPLRPRFEAYVRPEVGIGPAGVVDTFLVWADLTHVGANFTDPANTARIDARTLFGAGAAIEAFAKRWRLSFTARDLADVRPKDVIGFPLPGRSFAVELTYRTERPR